MNLISGDRTHITPHRCRNADGTSVSIWCSRYNIARRIFRPREHIRLGYLIFLLAQYSHLSQRHHIFDLGSDVAVWMLEIIFYCTLEFRIISHSQILLFKQKVSVYQIQTWRKDCKGCPMSSVPLYLSICHIMYIMIWAFQCIPNCHECHQKLPQMYGPSCDSTDLSRSPQLQCCQRIPFIAMRQRQRWWRTK